MQFYEAATAASQGARRYQEDAAVFRKVNADARGLLVVLADGMGGHAGGAIASRLVCDRFIECFEVAAGATCDRLIASLDAANDAIAKSVGAEPTLSGMGSTVVGAIFGDAGLEWVSVGDSPLYLYRRNEIALLNEDHSLAPALDQLAAAGEITVEAARHDPRRHMLRSAVTGEDLDLVDLSRKPLALEIGDYVLVASDGIHTLDEAEVARTVAGYASAGPQAVADALVRAVIDVREPHQDNVTVIAVRLTSAAQADDGDRH